MEKFKSFITEAKVEKYRILVISAEPDNSKLFHTAKRVTDEAKKAGHKVYVVKVEGAIVPMTTVIRFITLMMKMDLN